MSFATRLAPMVALLAAHFCGPAQAADYETGESLVCDTQGQVERYRRVITMIEQADADGFGSCSNEGECEAVCPKEIPISNIATMSREYMWAMLTAGK